MPFSPKKIIPYVQITRPDHWFKIIFVLPGIALALFLKDTRPNPETILLGLIVACLTASANYCINEYLDAEFDKKHPTKYLRPAAQGLVSKHGVIIEYIFLVTIILFLSLHINITFFLFSLLFLIMGLLYNVPPIRTKDVPYLDVISESINNPIRLLLGWSLVLPTVLPPCSFVLAYWSAGAFLMTLKRYAEIKRLHNHETILLYRPSLAGYSAEKLLSCAVFYAMNAALFLGIFLIKYKIELIILFPILALLFSWYFSIAQKHNSVAQTPKKLYYEREFVVFVLLLPVIFCILLFVDIPCLNLLTMPYVVK